MHSHFHQINDYKLLKRFYPLRFAVDKKRLGMKRMVKLLIAAALCTVMGACNIDALFSGDSADSEQTAELDHGMMVLGRQLEDPYSVKNITKALQALYPTKAGEIDVSATDLYVRFLPESQEEYDRLVEMGVEMLDHPLDYEIVREGDYYHDPEIPEGDITWQYAVVSPDFKFPPSIPFEVLDRCHITEHEVFTRSGEEYVDWEAVERESFRLTGNASMLEDEALTKAGAAKPSGRITLVDDRKDSPEGVKGVRVACNVFVKIGQAYTDENGYYEIDKSFSTKPRYWLVFKNKRGFGIGLNLILVGGSSSTMGRHSQEGCSLEVRKESDRSLFSRCVVNNTVCDYFEKCKTAEGTIKAPPSNLRIWIFQKLSASSTIMMQHGAAIDNVKLIKKYLGDWAKLVKWFLPDVTLGLRDDKDYAAIYATTVHELAHASHFQQVGVEWWDKLVEYVLSSYLTSGLMTYGTGGEQNAGYCEVAEMWAYYLSSKMFRERYPGNPAMFGTSFWFYPQVFYYLDDRGLDFYRIFKALISTVTDREKLQDKLLALYPEFRNNINLAFNRYL